MGIKANFTQADIRKRFDAFLQDVEREQIEDLQRLGEKCVTHARSIPKEQGFEDQTGNLRSSIGYMVFVDGVAIHSFYKQVKEGVTGIKAGETLAKKVGEQTKGVCLVVTAGMNYALHLETKGRDVLTSAEHLAERELPRMLEKLLSNIKKA
jgi:hypothetical protein